MKPRAPALAVSVALAILSTALLSACGEPTTDTAARTPASKSVPLAQLPDTAQPLHYRLSLDVDPERERFNGVATIDVALNAPARRLWMHGNKLDVEHISVVADGNTSDLDPRAFEQRTDDGVAALSVDPGRGTGK
jgi:alanyl aminopeptidase